MVEVHNLHKLFGDIHAVRGVSFSIAQGEIVGLLGHNGAGKTTTIRMIAGYTVPDAGVVKLNGFESAIDRAKAVASLGYLPEHNPLYPEMRAEEYLDFRGKLFGMDRVSRKAGVARVIDRCRLSTVRRQRIGTLSKGFRQRVGLAGALLHDPKVLLLDEPTNGLDPSQIHETRVLIRELGEQRTMLISSHILGEIEKLCGRVIIFAGGKVRADESVAALVGGAAGTGDAARSGIHIRARGTPEQARLFEHALAQLSPPVRVGRANTPTDDAPHDGSFAWECPVQDAAHGALDRAAMESLCARVADASLRAGLALTRLAPVGAGDGNVPARKTLESVFLRMMDDDRAETKP